MQILKKRSKLLLIVIAIAMLVAVGMSFALWDTIAVKATNGDLSSYANAKVGDIIKFGKYYQTGIKDETTGEYEKTAIEWLVVDKDERIGQLTLMSKHILAAGSYFGNYYFNSAGKGGFHYNVDLTEVGGNAYNQAYVESTARAFLNNLERRDLGGDSFVSGEFKTSATSSDSNTGRLLTSVGFSNRKYNIIGAIYQRPINNEEYKNRPATRGFYDEAFTDDEKAMIVPKKIAGYIGYRWPADTNEPSKMSNIDGDLDKVWLPSVTELNVMASDYNFINASDEAGSTVFQYFRDKTDVALHEALKATRTEFVINNSKAMNYSIPVYKYQSTEINEDIHTSLNSLDYYWTRSPLSNSYSFICYVHDSGLFAYDYGSNGSNIGVRPCIILKY